MARSAIVILSLTALVLAVSAKTKYPSLDTGMEIVDRAYEHVCWYENLKQLYPATGGSTSFSNCTGQVAFQIEGLVPQLDQPAVTEEVASEWFGDFVRGTMNRLTPEFENTCGKYLKDAKMAPASDESAVLNDSGKDYPFKGFASCLIQELRTKYGQKAVDAVIAEKVKGKRDFRTVMLERENEHRAIHGVKPFQSDPQLNKDAQAWADNIAKRCLTGYPHDDEGTKAKKQGENIFRSGASGTLPEDEAYSAANSWYSEIEFYDFNTGDSVEPGNREKQVGHFTATVWKETTSAGYGYAYNPKCGMWKVFVVARYSPPGNVIFNGVRQHSKNVLPPHH